MFLSVFSGTETGKKAEWAIDDGGCRW